MRLINRTWNNLLKRWKVKRDAGIWKNHFSRIEEQLKLLTKGLEERISEEVANQMKLILEPKVKDLEPIKPYILPLSFSERQFLRAISTQPPVIVDSSIQESVLSEEEPCDVKPTFCVNSYSIDYTLSHVDYMFDDDWFDSDDKVSYNLIHATTMNHCCSSPFTFINSPLSQLS